MVSLLEKKSQIPQRPANYKKTIPKIESKTSMQAKLYKFWILFDIKENRNYHALGYQSILVPF
jgi:hypothetical protein